MPSGGISASLTAPLLSWYDAGHRDLPWRAEPTPYRVWVSEIMLQQTRVEAVRGYFSRWMKALPTVHALAEAPEDVYLKLWEGLGYYSRVRNLHRAAVELCERFGGELPADYDALLKLPGIGEYTAGAVASIAFGLPVPAVDGNVLRVAARVTDDRTPITDPKYKKAVRGQLAAVMPGDRPGDLNQALMELGATVCVPNGAPKCSECPLTHLCASFHHGTTGLVPVRSPKKARRIERRTVLLVRCGSLVALNKRPADGLLGGLWELPSLEGHLPPGKTRQLLESRGWQIQKLLSLRPAKHIFTHVEWHMNGYYIELGDAPEGLTLVTPSALRVDYALPSAFRAFLTIIEDEV
ncbi:A/G-specific adenine glycosylase [Agathobaculum sp.]|uniref:A/G-specific adenine glycosylase n=1 Tax=Agathobaculum sp. TaxID=2048138 RepID=UPI002A82211B|nr:A/G-specific adenine glycosylase [Agathobaculum sp.]MDY3617450.1 A/G-specific adenine glycosylase [Agathobaculum sp.]